MIIVGIYIKLKNFIFWQVLHVFVEILFIKKLRIAIKKLNNIRVDIYVYNIHIFMFI